MASRTSDVNLIIRARNEADRAIENVADALQGLFSNAEDANGGIADLGKTLAAIDRTFATVTQKADQAAAAFGRQENAIAGNRAALQAIRDQMEGAGRAAEQLRVSLVDEVLAGGNQAPIIQQIKQVEQEQAKLAAQADKLTRTLATQEAALDGSRSSLQQLGSTANAVEQAQAEAAARIELTTQALNEQAAAGERVTDIQRRINSLTGVDRPNATGSAAAAANVLLEADNIFRRAEARQAEITKLREQEAATAALADAERAQRQFNTFQGVTSDPRGAQARESAQAFIQAAEAEEQMEREARQLRAQLDPLADIQQRFNTQLERYRSLAAAGKISTQELARAEDQLADQATRARLALDNVGNRTSAGLFGLKPYELQNLGYQVNDVVTQLASGTSLAQTLGQQGGQILQLFPRLTSSLLSALKDPRIAAIVAVVAGIAAGFKEAADQADRLRLFSADLSVRADGGNYDAGKLAAQATAFERMGASAKDANAAVQALLASGARQEDFGQLGKTAEGIAATLGISLPEAVKKATGGLLSGYDAVAKLDDELNFLTQSEREHIRTLFESGNAEAARREALEAASRQFGKVAELQRGPWGEAAKSLGNAWDALVKYIANTAPVKITIAVLSELAGAVKAVGDAIAGAVGDGANTGNAAAARLGQVQSQIKTLQADIDQYQAALDKLPVGSRVAGTYSRLIDQSKRQLATAQDELKRLEQNAPDTVNDSSMAKRRADRLSEIDLEQQLQALRNRGQQGLSKADSLRRAQLAGEQAYREEVKKTGDTVIAARLREIAAAKEAAEVDKQNDAARKAAAADRERQIQQFERRVVGAEGGTAKNPFSSAKGYGQFTERTFVDVYSRVPGADQSLSRDQILALRNNERVARGVIDQYARENAKFLERLGKQVTAGNLYLAHFLGQAGARAVLTADPNTPVDQVIRDPRALRGNQGYLRTNNGKGRYRTTGELQTFIAGRVGDTGAAQTGLVEEQARIEEANVDRQDQLNQAIRHGLEDRQQTVESLRAEQGLYGLGLLAEQKRQAVLKAELELRQKVEEANKNLKPGESAATITQEQIDKTRELAAQTFDAQHARDALNAALGDAQRPLDTLQQQADLLRQQADYLRSIGDFQAADDVENQLVTVNDKIQAAIDKLIEFYRALSPEQRVELGILTEKQLDNIISGLQLASDKTEEWGRVAGIPGQQIAAALSSALSGAFERFIEKVASGKNVFKSLGEAALDFAANFVRAIAQIITQLLAYALAVTVLRALGVPVPSIGVGVKHGGGIAGDAGGMRRTVHPGLFAGAMRFHTGGVVGLKPNEVPIIAEREEEILTKGDPRHRRNGGLSKGGASAEASGNVTVVNLFDPAAAAEQILRTPAGEKALLNVVQQNRSAFRAALQN